MLRPHSSFVSSPHVTAWARNCSTWHAMLWTGSWSTRGGRTRTGYWPPSDRRTHTSWPTWNPHPHRRSHTWADTRSTRHSHSGTHSGLAWSVHTWTIGSPAWRSHHSRARTRTGWPVHTRATLSDRCWMRCWTTRCDGLLSYNHVASKGLPANVRCSQNTRRLAFHDIGGDRGCNRLPRTLDSTKGGNCAALNAGHYAQKLAPGSPLAMKIQHELSIDAQQCRCKTAYAYSATHDLHRNGQRCA